MKKFLSAAIAVIYIFTKVPQITAAEERIESTIPSAKAYILTEASTGKVLSGYNLDEKLPMASITKIMLLLLVAEDLTAGKINFNDSVPTSANAANMDGSVIWLESGEIMLLSEMIKAIVISSANDAAVAVAEFIGGNEENFVKRMNKRAKELGMENTNFTGVVGYDNENHYTTVKDTALLMSHLFKYNFFSEYMLTRLDSSRTGTSRETQLLNTNKMASYYDGILGGKTGTTDNAGYCIALCAERQDLRLISVVLGARSDRDRFDLSEYLLDSGFENYQFFTPEIDYSALTPVKVEGGVNKFVGIEPVKLPRSIIPKGQGKNIDYHYEIPEIINSPVKKGDIIGKITATLGSEIIFESGIAATDNVEELTFSKSIFFLIKEFFRL